MAYAQWVEINIKPINFNTTIKNVRADWGKFYSGSKDNEIDVSKINNHQISENDSYTISSCGRSDSASGTEGKFDLYDGNTHIGEYYWDCPWGSKTNISNWNPSSEDYIVQVTGGNLDSGALGNIFLKVVKI